MAWWRLRMINCYCEMQELVQWPTNEDLYDAGYCLDRYTRVH